MKTIYIHIGLGKTGTTSIQKFLSYNHRELELRGVHYILAGGGAAAGGHQTLAKSCIENIPSYMEFGGDFGADRNDILSELESSKEQIILLSAENFQLAEPRLVKSFFEQNESEYAFKIILFVRSQDELVESEFNQLVKVRSQTRTIKEYIESEFEGDYWALASRWASVFDSENLICRVYDAAKTSAIADLLTCLPLDDTAVAELQNREELKINTSLGAVELYNKILQNEHTAACADGGPSLSDNAAIGVQVPAVVMDSLCASKVRERYSASNLLFSEHFLGGPVADFGGMRYSDRQRDDYYSYWESLLE